MPRTVLLRLYIAWDGTNYIDESARLIQASGENRLTAPDQVGSGRGIVDRCQLDLHNADGRYSPLNTGSAIYSYISGGGAYHRPMYLEASINGGTNYYRVFTGVIKLPQERTPTPNQIATVTIECRSKDELLLGRRMSTTATSMAAANAAGYTEGDVIAAWLTAAGISATVDEGMFVIPWAWMDDESVLEEIWQLAAACGGRFYCDPDGTYRFEDVTHWLKSPHATSQETLTRDDFTDLTPSYSDTELYSTITVETSPRQAGALDKLWEPDETVIVPPSTTKTMTARLRQPASLINSPTYSAATAGGNDITSSVTVSMTAANVQRVELSIANAHATEAAYMHPLMITGRQLEGGPTQEETRDSATHGSNGTFWTARGTRSKALRGNAYIQTRAHAAALALFLLHRSEYPRLTYRLRGCPGKPTRRCGDRITINDTALMSAARDAFIVGITWRLTGNGFSQDLECIDAAALYPYQSTGYFVLGTNKLGASGSLTAPIFY